MSDWLEQPGYMTSKTNESSAYQEFSELYLGIFFSIFKWLSEYLQMTWNS